MVYCVLSIDRLDLALGNVGSNSKATASVSQARRGADARSSVDSRAKRGGQLRARPNQPLLERVWDALTIQIKIEYHILPKRNY
eukprot:6177454-Pleurochrysis_carterae.AAC.1